MSFEKQPDPSTDPERRRAKSRSIVERMRQKREASEAQAEDVSREYRVAIQTHGEHGVYTVDVWYVKADGHLTAVMKAPIPGKYNNSKFFRVITEVK